MSWSIKVDNLSKLYRYGSLVASSDLFYQSINNTMAKVGALFSKKDSKSTIKQENSYAVLPPNLVVSKEQMQDCPANHFWALKNISFEIAQGDRVALIGKNGSGKSTLLKILSRITLPTEGSFQFKGKLLSLLEVGTGFHPDLSGRENIYLNAKINGMSHRTISQVIDSIIEFSELGKQIDTPIKRYSSGMYMRLAFSVAAFIESEILIVDEVLAVGDRSFQKKCLDKMLEISNKGRTLIFVSHDMNAVSNLCNKALEFSHGRIVPATESESFGNGLKTVRSAIKNYIIDNQFVSQRVWTEKNAPQLAGGKIKLSRVYLNNDKKEITDSFYVTEDIHIMIEYQMASNHEKFQFNLFVYTLNGQKILYSPHILKEDAGFFKINCTIPRRFLNVGEYRLDLQINTFLDPLNPLEIQDVLSFSVIEHEPHERDVSKGFPILSSLDWQQQIKASLDLEINS